MESQKGQEVSPHPPMAADPPHWCLPTRLLPPGLPKDALPWAGGEVSALKPKPWLSLCGPAGPMPRAQVPEVWTGPSAQLAEAEPASGLVVGP